MKKNVILLIFMLAIPLFGFAAVGDTFTVEKLKYTILNEDTVVNSQTYGTVSVGQAYTNSNGIFKPTGHLVIPATIVHGNNVYYVTKISDHTDNSNTPAGFYRCEITSINLPEGLQYIGYKAFAQCSKITGEITIPSTVNYFHERAFYGCAKISKVILRSKFVPSLAESATGIFNLSPNNDVYPIFIVENDLIYNYLTAWNRIALVFYEESSNIFSVGGLRYQVTNKEQKEVCVYNGILTGSITIPENVTYNNEQYKVTSLKDEAFSELKNITSIILSNNIREIGVKAFYKCFDLKSIDFNNNLTTIKEKAFATTQNLKSNIIFPETLQSLGYHAFYGCNTDSVIFQGYSAPEFIPEISTNNKATASSLFGTGLHPKSFHILCGAKGFENWNVEINNDCPIIDIIKNNSLSGLPDDKSQEDFGKITYTRTFTPGVWETLYLPFELEDMTVTVQNVNEGKPFSVNYPWNENDGGYFHLAKLGSDGYFEYIQGSNAELKGKNAYIIQFPSEDFKDVPVTFSSKDNYNHIPNSFEQEAPTSDYTMHANTTLQPQELNNPAYYLGTDNNFKHTGTYTLQPFECYLTPIIETQSYVNPRMMSVRFRPQSGVTTDVPTINNNPLLCQRNGNTLIIQTNGNPVNIYNINGLLLHSFAEGQEKVSVTLNSGCYIINSLGYTEKIIF